MLHILTRWMVCNNLNIGSCSGGAFMHVEVILSRIHLCAMHTLYSEDLHSERLSSIFLQSFGFDDPFDFFNSKPAFAWIFTVTSSL